MRSFEEDNDNDDERMPVEMRVLPRPVLEPHIV